LARWRLNWRGPVTVTGRASTRRSARYRRLTSGSDESVSPATMASGLVAGRVRRARASGPI